MIGLVVTLRVELVVVTLKDGFVDDVAFSMLDFEVTSDTDVDSVKSLNIGLCVKLLAKIVNCVVVFWRADTVVGLSET